MGRLRSSGAQPRDQVAVGRWKVELRETLRRDPVHGLVLARLDRSRLAPATIEVDHDRSFGILPLDGFDPLADLEARRELFLELAPERVLQRLAGFTLAPRKLPQASQVRAGAAPRDQKAALLVLDQSGYDLDETSQPRSSRRSA